MVAVPVHPAAYSRHISSGSEDGTVKEKHEGGDEPRGVHGPHSHTGGHGSGEAREGKSGHGELTKVGICSAICTSLFGPSSRRLYSGHWLLGPLLCPEYCDVCTAVWVGIAFDLIA